MNDAYCRLYHLCIGTWVYPVAAGLFELRALRFAPRDVFTRRTTLDESALWGAHRPPRGLARDAPLQTRTMTTQPGHLFAAAPPPGVIDISAGTHGPFLVTFGACWIRGEPDGSCLLRTPRIRESGRLGQPPDGPCWRRALRPDATRRPLQHAEPCEQVNLKPRNYRRVSSRHLPGAH